MSRTKQTPCWAAFLVVALAIAGCEASKETSGTVAVASTASCQQKRALWDTEFPKIVPGPPTVRIKAIEAIAEKIGDDPEQCAAELIQKALQVEKARLLTLRRGEAKVSAAAIYTCANLSQALKCVGSVADDTAHLGASLNVVAVSLAPGERVKLELDAAVSMATIRLYIAATSSLMEAPIYTELPVDELGSFTVPQFSEPMVLFAIVKGSSSSVYNKFVWLAKPYLRN